MISNKLALISTAILATLPFLGDEWNKKTFLTFSHCVK
jgi:hypothetical protein